jgi:hypothetical protein
MWSEGRLHAKIITVHLFPLAGTSRNEARVEVVFLLTCLLRSSILGWMLEHQGLCALWVVALRLLSSRKEISRAAQWKCQL